MSNNKFKTVSRRPLVILTIVFVVVVVIVGAVTWKVTKDAFEKPAVSELQITATTTKPGTDVQDVTEPIYTSEELKEKPWLSLRMSRDVLPLHYDITMFPDFYGDHGTFYGNQTIELQVNKPTRYFLIHIHTLYMNITSAALADNSTGERIGIIRTFYYAPNEFYVMEADRLVHSSVTMMLSFEGSLTKAIMGIYKSTYYDTQTGEKRSLASSKFEPTYARQAFPCFDEPNIKAKFTITLVHKPNYTALSNMPQDGPSKEYPGFSGMVASKFLQSVKMSTYLVCFIVCDFKSVHTVSNKGIPIRVFATPDKISQTQYSLELAKYTLDTYEIMFNMTYPLPKLDLIAIPDFVSGAMEHWGLITFRESRLLYDPNQTSLASREVVAFVVAHEMAHQWFGNIVTMDWWNDLWLNEGFASFMEYVGIAEKETTWDTENLMLVSDYFPVMKEDSRLSSHPIVVDVQKPSQITSVFDNISYLKGASIIRMLEAIMGKQKFFDGISEYLKKYEWGNARTDDLWNALTEYDKTLNIKHIMDTWTLQDGFPYINISLVTDESGTTNVTAIQKRFLSVPYDVANSSSSPFGYMWYIYLNYKTSTGINGTQIMDLQEKISFSANLSLDKPNNLVKFNYGQHGFYRVLYPDSMWKRFSDHLLNNNPGNWTLSEADRAGLLSDAFSLAAAGLLSYEIPLEMMSYLDTEQGFIPWRAALANGISAITEILRTDPEFVLWKHFLVTRLQAPLSRLGYDDIGLHNERKLRADLINAAASVEDAAILYISEQFHDWLQNNASISVNLRRVVYTYGMFYSGSDADWEKVWAKYLVEPSPQEKELLAACLANARSPHLIARLLDLAKREDGIMRQDFFTVIRNIGLNSAATGMLWDWARENYQTFVDRYTVADRNFGTMIYYIVKDYSSELRLKEVKDFFAQYPEAGAGKRSRKMAVESIERNIHWMKTYKPVIIDWLKRKLLS